MKRFTPTEKNNIRQKAEWKNENKIYKTDVTYAAETDGKYYTKKKKIYTILNEI